MEGNCNFWLRGSGAQSRWRCSQKANQNKGGGGTLPPPLSPQPLSPSDRTFTKISEKHDENYKNTGNMVNTMARREKMPLGARNNGRLVGRIAL